MELARRATGEPCESPFAGMRFLVVGELAGVGLDPIGQPDVESVASEALMHIDRLGSAAAGASGLPEHSAEMVASWLFIVEERGRKSGTLQHPPVVSRHGTSLCVSRFCRNNSIPTFDSRSASSRGNGGSLIVQS